MEDVPVYRDRADDVYQRIGGSLSRTFDTARDAWLTAVVAGKMDGRDWDDYTAAVERVTTENHDFQDEAGIDETFDDGAADGRSTTPSTNSRMGQRPRQRWLTIHLSKYTTEGATDDHPRRQPTIGATPLTVEELCVDFQAELRVALMMTARMDNVNNRPSVDPRCVSSARVLVLLELFDPICVWAASVRELLVTFSSCGGVLGSSGRFFTGDKIDYVNVQVGREKSSSCLLAIFPELAGDNDDLKAAANADTAMHLALHSCKKGNVPILAVCYENIWSPAIVRRQGNKHKLATCFLLSCASHPLGCIHAQAVNEYNRLEAAASLAAAADLAVALKFGPSGYLDDEDQEQEDDEKQTPGGSGGPAPPAEVAPPTPLSLRVRRTRIIFPCPAEVQHWNRYSVLIDSCVQAGKTKTMAIVHAEAMCLRCNRPRDVDTPVEPEDAVLFTIRGRAKILVGSWYCIDCGLSVEYDGALNGLFVATRDTVYARTFLDAMLELFGIALSTMAATSEFLARLLRNTAA